MANILRLPFPDNPLKRGSSFFVLHVTVHPYHFKTGNVFSAFRDPISLAIRDTLDLKLGDIVAVGEDEIFLTRGAKSFIAQFPAEEFYSPQPSQKLRSITLKFKEV